MVAILRIQRKTTTKQSNQNIGVHFYTVMYNKVKRNGVEKNKNITINVSSIIPILSLRCRSRLNLFNEIHNINSHIYLNITEVFKSLNSICMHASK